MKGRGCKGVTRKDFPSLFNKCPGLPIRGSLGDFRSNGGYGRRRRGLQDRPDVDKVSFGVAYSFKATPRLCPSTSIWFRFKHMFVFCDRKCEDGIKRFRPIRKLGAYSDGRPCARIGNKADLSLDGDLL
jgi:hypothetical protein